jgi:hypothetical protein
LKITQPDEVLTLLTLPAGSIFIGYAFMVAKKNTALLCFYTQGKEGYLFSFADHKSHVDDSLFLFYGYQ